MKTFRDGQDKRKTLQRVAEFRPMRPNEVREQTGEMYFCDINGKARTCRVSGQLKTWKRNALRFRLPVKYGMYESGAWVCDDGVVVNAESHSGIYPMVQITDWREEKIAK